MSRKIKKAFEKCPTKHLFVSLNVALDLVIFTRFLFFDESILKMFPKFVYNLNLLDVSNEEVQRVDYVHVWTTIYKYYIFNVLCGCLSA